MDADADAGHARVLQGLQEGRGHVVRVEFHTDAVSDVKVFLHRLDDLRHAARGEGGGSAAEIQAGGRLFCACLRSHEADLLDESVDVAVTGVF